MQDPDHPTFAEPALPSPANAILNPPPPAGNDLEAIDYRSNPSAAQGGAQPGQHVGPMPDREIRSYGIPAIDDQYDRMGEYKGVDRT